MILLLALVSGLALGYVFERGDLCFHSTLRGLFRIPKQLNLMRSYVLVIIITAPVLWGLRALGWINPWIAPFQWQANVFGGVLFGIGMVVASSCITGLFYKLGHGMLGTLIGLLTWAAGDLLVYLGPLRPLREALVSAEFQVVGESATMLNNFGAAGPIVLFALLVAAVIWLWRSPAEGRNVRGKLWGWLPLGAGLSVVIIIAWLVSDAAGVNYPYGTSYVPSELFLALRDGGAIGWIPIALLGLLPGAFIAARRSGTLWVRGETVRRYLELGAGGFLMGVAAAIAGGCNLGHSLIGVPLLSLGSITTTISMGVGVFLAHNLSRVLTAKQASVTGNIV